jgi:very-short-patch-repair endonuclease
LIHYRRNSKSIARELRINMTQGERTLWMRLRSRQVSGIQFYRQKPLGPYIVDFYAASVRLVIEVDGSQHKQPLQHEADIERDAYLNLLDLKVLRFNNWQVLEETDNVMKVINNTVDDLIM